MTGDKRVCGGSGHLWSVRDRSTKPNIFVSLKGTIHPKMNILLHLLGELSLKVTSMFPLCTFIIVSQLISMLLLAAAAASPT